MNQSALIRPDWTPATIALMVLGFVVFWPLGLAMLAYIIFGDRLKTFKKDANDTVDGMFASCRGKFRSGRRVQHGQPGLAAAAGSRRGRDRRACAAR